MSIYNNQPDGMNRDQLEILKAEMERRKQLQQPTRGKIIPDQEVTPEQKSQAIAQGAQLLGQVQGGQEGGVLSSAASGAAAGAQLGSPKAALIGAGAGALAGVMGARASRKAAEREAKARMLRNISQIEENKGVSQANILGQLMAGLGSKR